MEVRSPTSPQRLVFAASIGNALEFYDIAVYAYFAPVIARLFFPSGREAVSYLLTFTAFGLTFIARPVGSIILGSYADRCGRRSSLLLSLTLMMIGTGIMAILPTYARIGVFAPLGICFSRLIQGFAVGGEIGSSTALMVEHAPPKLKTFYSAFQSISQGFSIAAAAVSGLILTTRLSPHHLESWGWRLPFVFGLLIGPVGLFLRRHLDETPDFLSATRTRFPVRSVFADSWAQLSLAMCLIAGPAASTYFVNYLPVYAIKNLGLPSWSGFASSLCGVFVAMPAWLAFSRFGDRLGLIRIMAFSCILRIVAVWPIFLFITHRPSAARLLLGEAIMSLVGSPYGAGLLAIIVRLFPTATRSLGISLAYNLGVFAFGGFAPAIFGWLIEKTGNKQAPSFYLIACGMISLIALGALHFNQQLLKGFTLKIPPKGEVETEVQQQQSRRE